MKELWKRVLLPATIPIAALAIIALTVLNVSRVLIAVEESNSPGLATALACVLAATMLGVCAYFASQAAEKRKHNEAFFAVFGAAALLVCGLWGYQAVETRADAEAREHPAEELGTPNATVDAFDLGFKEKTLSAAPGDFILEYVNSGTQAHTLVIEGQPGKLEVGSKGATDKGKWTLQPGEYVYFCDVSGHRAAGMEGKLTVAEGAGGGGGGGGAGQTVEVGNTLAFTPAEITAPAGPLKITLKATTGLAHTFVIDGAPEFKKLSVAKQGDAPSGTFDAKPGEHTFYCDIPGHRQAGMEGKIKIS